jgi:membrane associated rhomboid family serine protease
VTIVLIFALIAGFLALNGAPDPAEALSQTALIPYNLTHGISLGVPAPATLLTSLGIHASLGHLLSNLLILGLCSPAVERLCGGDRYLGLFLLCGVVGGLAQVALDPGSHRPIIGASGAISGLLGAYVLRYPLARTVLGIPMIIPLLFWAALQGAESGLFVTASTLEPEPGAIAYAAHFGGFLCGLLTIGLFEL